MIFFYILITFQFDYRFEIFKPMHEMWKDYIKLLLKSTGYCYCVFAIDEFCSFLSSSFPALFFCHGHGFYNYDNKPV
jgi:hypothetical protein